MVKLSVVVPAYNESERIVGSLKKICAFLKKKKISAEVIVVNDGSSDNTADVVKVDRLIRVISYPVNHGKGFAVKTGMLAAKGDVVMFLDADFSTPIDEYDKLAGFIPEYDVVIGSRALKGTEIKVRQPFYRELMGKTFNLIVQVFAVHGIWDTQCGFKMFKRDVARDIFSRGLIDRWGFDVEVLFLARKLNYRIKEVPVTWFNDARSHVHAIRDSYRMFKEIFIIRMNNLKGRY